MSKNTAFPGFSQRPPWLGADLQTIRNTICGPLLDPGAFKAQRLYLPMTDGTGDSLSAIVQGPDNDPRKPMIVLIHGLTGNEGSPYMQTSAAFFLRQGYRVMRLNLRGSGPSRQTCRLMYHAGRTPDLRDALDAMEPDLKKNGLYFMGFSLGANMLLKFAAEYGKDFPVKGLVSVSAPIDLNACNIQMLKKRNVVYQRYVVNCLKTDALSGSAEVTENEHEAVLKSRTIYEFDTLFNAPRNGYSSAEEYYEKNMALGFMHDIPVPALIIHALNDPWIPGKTYTEYPWRINKHLVPLLSGGGGHVGFHGTGYPVPWHDRCASIFFDQLTR